MRKLTSIVAVNKAGIIGCRNSLPWRVKSDLAFFRATTTGNVVLMGRKTYDSLGRCLPKRHNVVLSNSFGLFESTDSCLLRNSIAEALIEVERAPRACKEAFVIGGATMYEQFSGFVDRYLITVVDKDVDDGDAFFDISVLSDVDNWSVKRVLERSAGEGDEASFEIFELIARDSTQPRRARQELIDQYDRGRMQGGGERKRLPMRQSCQLSPSFEW